MSRTLHNLSHYHLTSFDMGQLVPVSAVEVCRGDYWQQNTEAVIRVTPQLKPIMHPVAVHVVHYYCPWRIVWTGWEDFITGVSATPPPTASFSRSEGDVLDYLGLPVDVTGSVGTLKLRAFNEIVNKYFIDKDIDTERTSTDNTLPRVRWQKDRFSTARPWPQAGTAVTLPLGSSAPLTGIGFNSQSLISSAGTVYETGGTSQATTHAVRGDRTTSTMLYGKQNSSTGDPEFYADLANATGPDIVAFREALAMQRYQEARARYGSDYADYLAYQGIKYRDSRLGEPEFLAAGRANLQFSEVLNTSNTNTGALVGHGIGAVRSNRFRRYLPEDGVVISMMYVRPKAIYTQGSEKIWWKTTKEDFFQKELELVGMEEVQNRELYTAHSSPTGTFGYAPRYDEYRGHRSRVSSEFRNSTSYDWHFGRIFASDPTLNSSFLECSPTKRVFADQTEDSLWCTIQNNIKVKRMVGRDRMPRVI